MGTVCILLDESGALANGGRGRVAEGVEQISWLQELAAAVGSEVFGAVLDSGRVTAQLSNLRSGSACRQASSAS